MLFDRKVVVSGKDPFSVFCFVSAFQVLLFTTENCKGNERSTWSSLLLSSLLSPA